MYDEGGVYTSSCLYFSLLQTSTTHKKNKPSQRQIIKELGLPYTSGVRHVLPAAKRQLILKRGEDLIWSALPPRRKYSKVSEEVKDGLKKWIINHPSVTESPLMNDTLIIKDKEKRR